MRILFLDFDGVLVTEQSIVRAKEEGVDLDQCLCPLAMSNLNHILSKMIDIRIVISSAWRLERSLEELKEILVRNGMESPHKIISTTPVFPRGSRSEEIKAWLSEYGEAVKAFAIVDDMPVVANLRGFLVQTNPRVGLLWDDGQKILRILKI